MTVLGAERAERGPDRWATWVAANTLAFAAGGAIAGATARVTGQPHYGVVTSTTDAVLIAARTAGMALAVWGTVVGAAQWLVLRRELDRVGWWIPATCAGWALAGVVAGTLSGFMGGAVTGLGRDVGVWGFVAAAAAGLVALGFLPVTLQWMILRRRVRRARRWLLGAAGAFLVAAVVAAGVVRWGFVSAIGVLRPEDFPSAQAWAWFGGVVGLLYGAMTGAVLVALRRGSSLERHSLAPPARALCPIERSSTRTRVP
jgi:hypothetical protein